MRFHEEPLTHILRAAAASLLFLAAPSGCRRRPAAVAPAPQTAAAVVPSVSRPLDLHPTRAQLRERIIERFMKPVMGRRESLRAVDRIVREYGPIVEEAAQLPEGQSALRAIARDAGIAPDDARKRWMRLQEADLLLESGGNPEDVSVAHAVGVAQWIYETGRRAGLKIALPESNRLTAQIDPLKRTEAWLEYLSSPGAEPGAPGAPAITSQQAAVQLPVIRARLEDLRVRRRRVDERYDPRPSILAHTRYLLGIHRRFPSLDWVFQAFHGGEAGVQRLVRKYVGVGGGASVAGLIRHGGKALTFEDVYFGATPRSHAQAFSYLYGRGDEHRFYWWKLLAAERAIALYRRDPATFRRSWESLLPGRAKEAVWYPNGPSLTIPDLTALKAARRAREVVPVSGIRGIEILPPALDRADAATYSALRPEAAGALQLIAALCRRSGASAALHLGDLVLTAKYAAHAAMLHPAPRTSSPPSGPRPGGGPPADFNYHTTGLAFDILRSTDLIQRKRVEYALGWLADRGAVWSMTAESGGPPHYHVVPNPAYRSALASIARTGRMPGM